MAELLGDAVDHFTGVVADHFGTQQRAAVHVGNQPHEAVGVVLAERARVGFKRGKSHCGFELGVFGVVLVHADAPQFDCRIHQLWHRGGILFACIRLEDIGYGNHRIGQRLVGGHAWIGDVADGVNMRHTGLQVSVHCDETLGIERHAGSVKRERIGVRTAARAEQHPVHRLHAAVAEGELDAVWQHFNTLRAAASTGFEVMACQCFVKDFQGGLRERAVGQRFALRDP